MLVPDPPRPLRDARNLTLSHGGAESNVAVWLAKLGCSAAWCSRLGDDALGHRIRREIAAAGVATDLVKFDAHARTGIYFKDPRPDGTVVLYYRDGSAAASMDTSDVDRALTRPPRILHLTGITPALSPSCARLVGYAIAEASSLGVTVSFDINYRAALWSGPAAAAAVLQPLAQRCDVVFTGSDEASMLWSVSTAMDISAVFGPRPMVVVKDGARPASVVEGSLVTAVPALSTRVVESVGAGDAFAAGFLYGLLRNMTAAEALRFGHLVASSALTSATDHADLIATPTRLEEIARHASMWREEKQMSGSEML